MKKKHSELLGIDYYLSKDDYEGTHEGLAVFSEQELVKLKKFKDILLKEDWQSLFDAKLDSGMLIYDLLPYLETKLNEKNNESLLQYNEINSNHDRREGMAKFYVEKIKKEVFKRDE